MAVDEPGEWTTGRTAVPAISRATMILAALDAAPEPPTFGDLARLVPLPRSSLHNLCSTLLDTGLVERSDDGHFQVGLRVVELGRRRLARMDIVRAFVEVADEFRFIEETLVLSVLHGADVTYVAIRAGTQRVAVRYEIGMRLPAAFTASGKAILSTLPEERVHALVGEVITSNVVAGASKRFDELSAELADTRARGFSVDDEETARGMICVGVPVIGSSSQEALGAVAISAVKVDHDLLVTAARVQEIAQRIGVRSP